MEAFLEVQSIQCHIAMWEYTLILNYTSLWTLYIMRDNGGAGHIVNCTVQLFRVTEDHFGLHGGGQPTSVTEALNHDCRCHGHESPVSGCLVVLCVPAFTTAEV